MVWSRVACFTALSEEKEVTMQTHRCPQHGGRSTRLQHLETGGSYERSSGVMMQHMSRQHNPHLVRAACLGKRHPLLFSHRLKTTRRFLVLRGCWTVVHKYLSICKPVTRCIQSTNTPLQQHIDGEIHTCLFDDQS